MNAEAEKLQFVLGTLGDTAPAEVSLGDLLDVNTSVRRTLRDVIKKEMLLEFKSDNVMDLIAVSGGTPSECECGVATGGIVQLAGISVDSIVVDPFTASGTLNVNLCPNCQNNGSFFNLTLSAATGVPTLIFNIDATNISEFMCDSGVVTISGIGNLNINNTTFFGGDFTIQLDSNTGIVSVSVTTGGGIATLLSAVIPGVGLAFTTC